MNKTTLIAADAAAAIPLVEPDATAPASIVSRALVQAAEVRVTLFEFAPGQELTTHTNRRRALIQILRGSGEFFFNDTWQRLDAGAFLHLPPNHPHAVRAPEAFSMLLTLCAEPNAAPGNA